MFVSASGEQRRNHWDIRRDVGHVRDGEQKP
jgi:hypothetical protein